jgi:UDP-N-acetyl-D-glucosamine dehydrogenase
VADALNERHKSVKGSSILVVGLAYKPDVDDERESPSYVLMDLLETRGAAVAYYDPYIPIIRPTREHPQWTGTKSVEWRADVIRGFDLVLIATRHSSVDYGELAKWADCIVDTRNAMAGAPVQPGQVWKA